MWHFVAMAFDSLERIFGLLHAWSDGSQATKLGAGWFATDMHHKPLSAGQALITRGPRSGSSLNEVAEVCGAIYALRSLPGKRIVLLHTDCDDVIKAVTDKAVPPYITDKKPSLVPVFETLILETKRQMHVMVERSMAPKKPRLMDVKVWAKRHRSFNVVAHDLVHTLAGEMSGSQSIARYPQMDALIDRVEIARENVVLEPAEFTY